MNEQHECDNDAFEQAVSVHFGVTSLTKKLVALTTQLGIDPSHSFELGDKVDTRTGVHRRGRSVWQLRSDGNVVSKSLADHLTWLLAKIEPCRLSIQQYLDDSEMEVDIRINCTCPGYIGGVSIPS